MHGIAPKFYQEIQFANYIPNHKVLFGCESVTIYCLRNYVMSTYQLVTQDELFDIFYFVQINDSNIPSKVSLKRNHLERKINRVMRKHKLYFL